MNKSTRNLLIIFVVLVAIVYIFFKGKDRINTQNVDEKLFAADSAKIDKIEITKSKESFTIEKINGRWQLTKPIMYEADTTAITPMLSNLQRFRIDNITSTNPEKFNNYLDTANNTVVTVYQEGKQLGKFELGKFALSYENSYLRIPGENRILLATGLNQTYFVKPMKDYRNKLIFAIPGFTIKQIDFKSIDSNHVDMSVLKDTAGTWYIGKDSVPSNNIQGFLNLMDNFNTEDFIDSTISTFPAPEWTITLHAAQQVVINLYKIPGSSPENFIVQASNNKQLFKMSSGYVYQLMKKRSDFIPPPPKTTSTDTKNTKKK